jgi:hypothetical protein
LKKTLLKLDFKGNEIILWGGDFNIVFNQELDRKGGKEKIQLKDQCIEIVDEISNRFELNDTWRLKNPDSKRFTWRQKNPQIHSRLDYWFLSDSIFDWVEEIKIIPAPRTDHSAVYISVSSFAKSDRGRGYWKLNNTIIDEENYIIGIREGLEVWKAETDEIDNRSKWEYIKFKIRQFSITYSKKKASIRQNTEKKLQQQRLVLTQQIDEAVIGESYELELELEEIIKQLNEIDKYKTAGVILRSKARWYEEGEKGTKYFLNLENRNQSKKCVNKLMKEDGTYTTDLKEILEIEKDFYKKLYTSRKEELRVDYSNLFDNLDLISLSEEEKEGKEGTLKLFECEKALSEMKNNKSPGNDGITAEFYKKFWPLVGKILINALNESFQVGQLTISQRQSVLTLLDKKKDKTLLKNWRPIALLNVDYKIASKALVNRVKPCLDELISKSQTAYVQGRNIADNIRAIADLMYYLKQTKSQGFLVSIDFEKAFDSVDFSFLKAVLTKMNFGPDFIHWIETFYNAPENCVINNGHTSGYFDMGRGVRQGDPLSPYLFIILSEVLTAMINSEKLICGITIEGDEIKLLQYADDTTGILSDIDSVKRFIKMVERFGKYSGLQVNREKTEALCLGTGKVSSDNKFGISWKNTIKVLGVFFSYDDEVATEKNFFEKIQEVKRIFQIWSTRNLTIYGRIILAKTFIISKFLYVTGALCIPEKFKKQLNSLVFKFIWNQKKEKIARNVLIRDIKDGGLRAPDIDSILTAAKHKWFLKCVGADNLIWKSFYNFFMKKANIKTSILSYSNFNLKYLNTKGIPKFYTEVFDAIKEIRSAFCKEILQNSSFLDEGVWYNENILINGKSVFYEDFYYSGIIHIRDLFNGENIKPFEEWAPDLSNADYLRWRGLVTAIQKYKVRIPIRDIINRNQEEIDIAEPVPCENLNTRIIYDKLIVNKTGGLQKPKIIKYGVDDENWEKIYGLAFLTVKDTKTRVFQYLILNNALVTNYWLNKWNIRNEFCTFCNKEIEDELHLFCTCDFVKDVINNIMRWAAEELNLDFNWNKHEILLGNTEGSIIENICILQYKRYIYECRCNEKRPCISGYKNSLKQRFRTEREIAFKNKQIPRFIERWENLVDIFDSSE